VASVRRYEDLVAWQICVELSAVVGEIVATGALAKRFELGDQMRNAAQSAPALIAEGFLRFTPEEFVRYLRMARAEIGELQTHLEVASRQGLLSDEQISRTVPLARRAMAITTNLLKSKLPMLKAKNGGTRQRR
jgi:four helix bundle protein